MEISYPRARPNYVQRCPRPFYGDVRSRQLVVDVKSLSSKPIDGR